MIALVGLGVFKILSKNHFDATLIFGFLSESTAQGIGFILCGIASFPRNILIDDNGIKINDLFTSFIKYSDLTEVKLTNAELFISNKDFSYQYRIFKLSDDVVHHVKSKIEEKYTLPNIVS